ncbi:hypothetical protein [Rossellomorea marisflavi]|uniref:hypothetical protein n=1 Tax=Rossellomorea marisflavi TaxID=189381 RepID=UPI003FA0E879
MRKFGYHADYVEAKTPDNRKVMVRQIKAWRAIPKYNIKQGDLGGWISSDSNLDQSDDSWVSANSYVYDNALVAEDSIVKDGAVLYGTARAVGRSRISQLQMGDNVEVYDSYVSGPMELTGDVYIERSKVYGNAEISKGVAIENSAIRLIDSKIQGTSIIIRHSEIESENMSILDRATLTHCVLGKPQRLKDIIISGKAELHQVRSGESKRIISKEILIGDNTFIKHASIRGSRIKIQDHSYLEGQVKGDIVLGSDVSIKDFGYVLNRTATLLRLTKTVLAGDGELIK